MQQILRYRHKVFAKSQMIISMTEKHENNYQPLLEDF
jgi:hypothetical protein